MKKGNKIKSKRGSRLLHCIRSTESDPERERASKMVEEGGPMGQVACKGRSRRIEGEAGQVAVAEDHS